ncbi:unnamed protein product [Anisakis simplex]|uniref:ShKT domain-containing protein n=1 Tax=Anisakis simplex TaxID=6269 RepID=A0A0M3J2K4_ANISI|nr:unnamed protein product [Anisakis simplex]
MQPGWHAIVKTSQNIAEHFAACKDYHAGCHKWSQAGECSRNAWMLENCRQSCRSCMDENELRRRCRVTIRRHPFELQRFQNDIDYEFN